MRNTRDALVEAAEALIRQRGYAGFSYADLAALVGISKASIHHHFPTKAALAAALLATYEERYRAALADILRRERDGLARIRAYASLYADGVERGLGCLCAAYAAELATLPEDLRDGLRRFFAGQIDFVARVLADGQEDGSISANLDAAAGARLIVAALEGSLMMERIVDGRPGFAAMLDALAAMLRPGASRSRHDAAPNR